MVNDWRGSFVCGCGVELGLIMRSSEAYQEELEHQQYMAEQLEIIKREERENSKSTEQNEGIDHVSESN